MKTVLLVAGCLVVAGCTNHVPDFAALRIELTALKQELELMRQHTEDLDPRVRVAEELAVRFFEEREAVVALDCSSGKVEVLTAAIANLAVRCNEARPLSDGYRLMLMLGNPTSGRVERVGLTLYAGTDALRGRSDQRMHVEVSSPLAPGSWTPVTVDWPGLRAEDSAEIAIRGQGVQVRLAQR